MNFLLPLTTLRLHFSKLITSGAVQISFRAYSKSHFPKPHWEHEHEATFVKLKHPPMLPRQTSTPSEDLPIIKAQVSKILDLLGCEAHLFLTGWYNELAGPSFRLDYAENTLSLVILSGPEIFEKCVMPFLQSQPEESLHDAKGGPLDRSMKHVFDRLSEQLRRMNYAVDAIHDFERGPTGKPRVLVQTAAHVSGAVEYFHRDRVKIKSPFWLTNSKLFGVAIHPDHGGWFTILGVMIFKNLIVSNANLLPKPPRPLPHIVETEIANLLKEFATNSKSNIWRDMLPRNTFTRYSENFMNYLATEHDKRWEFVKLLLPRKRCSG